MPERTIQTVAANITPAWVGRDILVGHLGRFEIVDVAQPQDGTTILYTGDGRFVIPDSTRVTYDGLGIMPGGAL